jgi:hypothetical protein
MKPLIIASFAFLMAALWQPISAHAASEDDCAIWLCLPGGFPSGCAGAKSAWQKRLRQGKSPLPSFSSCSNDRATEGHYRLGIERFMSCPAGHVGIDQYSYRHNDQVRVCLSQACLNQNPQAMTLLEQGFEANLGCAVSYAPKRRKQHYIEMWVDDTYLGQFFYQ